jgi:alcohol dehydrogenase (cytochrome c)
MRMIRAGQFACVLAAAAIASLAAQQAPSPQVTLQDLRNGLKDPTRWLQYSGDYSAHRHSPLTQLTPSNVGRLTAQWTFQTDQSPFMLTGRSGGLGVPLALDGVLYFAGNNNRVWALDERTGRQIWQYTRDMPPDVASRTTRAITRGLAVLGNKLFLGTLDAHVVTLDIKTGKVVWDTAMGDYTKFYTVTSAPLVIGDKVVIGISGADRGALRFFIDAYDVETGKREWRFYTTPEPGEPGSETWPNAEAMSRGGGATWTIGSYDPELNLVYWGTGNPYGPGDVRPGNNLYTGSIVALDGTTGKLRWYYQVVPHDIHDYDVDVIPVLADLQIAGQRRKVVMIAPKTPYFLVLDRETGKFLKAHPLIDSAKNWGEVGPDGRPIIAKENGTKCLPDIHGASNFWPPSFDPAQGLFFVTVHNVCTIFNLPQPGKVSGAPGSWTVGGAGYAALRAFDPASGTVKWEYRYPPSDFGLTGVSQIRPNGGIALSGGVTSTASGLIFTGDNEGNFIAFDSRTGKPLWHYQTGAPVWGSAAITYMLDGKQHVLVSAGLTLTDFALPDIPPR